MALTIAQLLPSLNQSIDGIGFLFGAGASFQAGYPLMTTLTSNVVAELTVRGAKIIYINVPIARRGHYPHLRF